MYTFESCAPFFFLSVDPVSEEASCPRLIISLFVFSSHGHLRFNIWLLTAYLKRNPSKTKPPEMDPKTFPKMFEELYIDKL